MAQLWRILGLFVAVMLQKLHWPRPLNWPCLP